ncbi:Flap endonuclease GEN 1-like, partial [Homarus americanus]
MALLKAGVLPVFVLEGDAPRLKWNTITSRNQRNFHHSAPSKNVSLKTGKRSQFKSILKQCGELLDLLGVPWVQALGEAEATCAALNYHQMVKGVITQDSDVFLYGGHTVFRNFTANQNKATMEKFSMDIIEDRLQLTRGGLITLGILLGCDYLPNGVQGVGKDTAVKLLRAWYKAGERDPVKRSTEELEAGVRERLLATDGFPFTEILQEFQHKLSRPTTKINWAQPRKNKKKSKDNIKKLTKDDPVKLVKDDTRKSVKDDPVRLTNDDPRKINLKDNLRKLNLDMNNSSSSSSVMDGNDKCYDFVMKSKHSLSNHCSIQVNSSEEFVADRNHVTKEKNNITLTDDEREEKLEDADLSLIIDRIINIKMSSHFPECGSVNRQGAEYINEKQKKNQNSCNSDQKAMTQCEGHYSRYNLGEEKVDIKNISWQKFNDSGKRDKTQRIIDSTIDFKLDDKENQPESLFDRVSKRLNKRHRKKGHLNRDLNLNPGSFDGRQKYKNVSHKDAQSSKKSISSGKVEEDIETPIERNTSSQLAFPSKVLMQMEFFCENNKENASKNSAESILSSSHDLFSPRSETIESSSQVSRDIFNITDDCLPTPPCSSSPKQHSTPYLTTERAVVKRSNTDIKLKSTLLSPNAQIVEMDGKNKLSLLTAISPLSKNLQDSSKKPLPDSSSSVHTFSKVSEMFVNDSVLRFNKSIISQGSSIVKENIIVSSSKNYNLSAILSTPRAPKKWNMESVCFKLIDSFNDCEGCVSYDATTSRSSPLSVMSTKELQQASFTKKISCAYNEEERSSLDKKDNYNNMSPIVTENRLKNARDEVKNNECKILEENIAFGNEESNDRTSSSPRTANNALTYDPFSPFGVGLTLAERLKIKCPNKNFAKLF